MSHRSRQIRRRKLRLESLEVRQVLAALVVLPPPVDATAPSPWQNEIAPHDVNRDGAITTRDAAAVLSGLASHGSIRLDDWPDGERPEGPGTGPMQAIDVDGDRALTPRDAQQILSDLFVHGDRIVNDANQDELGPGAAEIDFEMGIAPPVEGSIDHIDDVDVFLANVDSDGVLTITNISRPISDVAVRVFDLEGNPLEAKRDGLFSGSAAIQEFDVLPGQYYVQVEGANAYVGPYSLEVLVFPSDPFQPFDELRDSQPGDDPHVDVLGDDATAVEVGQERLSFIDHPGDVDVFLLRDSGVNAYVTASSVRSGDAIRLQAWDLDGRLLVEATRGEAMTLDHGQDYYLVVRAEDETATGDYLLSVAPALNPPPRDTDSELGEDPHADQVGQEATVLELVEHMPGLSNTHVNSYIDRAGDVDVFRMAIPAGTDASGFVLAEFPMIVSVADQNGDLVSEVLFSREAPLTPIEFGQGAEVYISVRAADPEQLGHYELMIGGFDAWRLFTRDEPADSAVGDDPHGDQLPTATLLLDPFHNEVHSYLDQPGDVDVFQLPVSQWGADRMQDRGLQLLLRGRDVDLIVELQDASGATLLRETVPANTTFGGIVEFNEDVDELFLSISSADGASAGEYYLRTGLPSF